MTIRWDVKDRAKQRGWENAQQFSLGAGITYPVAARVLEGKPLERIEVATLEKLAKVFGVKPWSLLDYDPKE